MNKNKIKKTRCPKNYAISESEIADILGCSVVTVKAARTSKRNSVQAKTIRAIDEIANEHKSLLIYKLKNL